MIPSITLLPGQKDVANKSDTSFSCSSSSGIASGPSSLDDNCEPDADFGDDNDVTDEHYALNNQTLIRTPRYKKALLKRSNATSELPKTFAQKGNLFSRQSNLLTDGRHPKPEKYDMDDTNGLEKIGSCSSKTNCLDMVFEDEDRFLPADLLVEPICQYPTKSNEHTLNDYKVG